MKKQRKPALVPKPGTSISNCTFNGAPTHDVETLKTIQAIAGALRELAEAMNVEPAPMIVIHHSDSPQ